VRRMPWRAILSSWARAPRGWLRFCPTEVDTAPACPLAEHTCVTRPGGERAGAETVSVQLKQSKGWPKQLTFAIVALGSTPRGDTAWLTAARRHI
jgi:hypothetical protein